MAIPLPAAQAQSDAAPDITVTLLGTGSPIVEPGSFGGKMPQGRAGAMTLVRAGEETLLFDAGRGVVERLYQANTKASDLTAVFLTHFHSDHIVGLPDLWLTGRLRLAWGSRTKVLDVYGPAGNAQFIFELAKAYDADVKARSTEPHAGIAGHEFKQDGVVYDRNGVRVTAFTVDHGPTKPSVGYRVDYNGRSVLISGDTRYDENVIKHGTGVDLLLHEVLVASPKLLQARPALKSIFDLHTSPEQCGEVFARTRPKLAAYTHLVFFGGPAFGAPVPAPTVDDMMAETRKTYQGPLVSGEDLMVFEIGDTVKVIPPKHASN
ncbi:MBL fold metallo-hydrolase [Pseudorhodoplanes sp.]|uniref:MBL fold metallo-hydrolase n=1 Tax=Pseudorhodoplanes sp. TaxID=1934341 RepID=UPI003D0D64AA